VSELAEIFGPGGRLERTVEGFRHRAQQAEFAQAVLETIEEGGVLIAEAGTGTGKTFAYLVPALLAGGRVIVSTGTKTLQDQLYHRDLPRVREALGASVDVALLKGRATFGYRDFKPLDPSLPGYRGATAMVDLSYVLLSITKFGVTATRDVQYSYDINQPYYVLSGATASIAQQVFGPIDVVVRGGLQQLQYRDRIGAAVAIADRVDHVESVGGGIGYHLGQATRIGFNVDQNRRISGVDARRFKGLTYGFSVTYGS